MTPEAWERVKAVFNEQSPASVPAGQMIGRYRVLSHLGAGGMGEVYLAEDPRLGRRIALKVLPLALSRDPGRLQRFEREARAASQLAHPNVCVVHEVADTDDGRRFITMEYVEGESLRAILDRHRASGTRVPVDEALDIVSQAAAGLAAAHAAGIVHRDIKPENLMRRPDGLVKVLDFGLAKQLLAAPGAEQSQPQTVETEPGTIMGTALYMSPEQARAGFVDARTDIWSLGVVLYEMLAGRPPFEGETAADVLVSILDRQPPPLTRLAAEETQHLQPVIERALAKDRDRRHPSAQVLVSDLSNARSGLLRHTGRPPTATATEPGRVPPRNAWRQVTGRFRRLPWRSVAVAVTVLAASGVLFAKLTRLRTNVPDSTSASRAWRAMPLESPVPWLATLADTALLAYNPSTRRLTRYDGDHWMPIRGFPAAEVEVQQPVHLTKGVPVLPVTPSPPFTCDRRGVCNTDATFTDFWSLAGDSAVKVDSVSQDAGIVNEFFEAGGNVYQTRMSYRGGAVAGPALLRFTDSRWMPIQLPIHVGLGRLFGDGRSRLYALAFFFMADFDSPDSVLAYDATTGWRVLDVRPTKHGYAEYWTGTASDASALVAGRECKTSMLAGGARGCRPLLLLHEDATGPWVDVPVNAGDDEFTILGGLPVDSNEFYVWGELQYDAMAGRWGFPCPSWVSCVWHVRGGVAEPVQALQGQAIRHMATLHGEPVALSRDGVVWGKHRGQWQRVESLAETGERHLDLLSPQVAVVTGMDVEIASMKPLPWGVRRPIDWNGSDSGAIRGKISSVVTIGDSSIYLLTVTGRVLALTCPTLRSTSIACRETDRPIIDQGVNQIGSYRDSTLVGVMSDGRVAALTGGNRRPVELPAGASLRGPTSIKTASSKIVILAEDGILVGRLPAPLRWLPVRLQRGLPLQAVAVLDSNTVAVLSRRGEAWRLGVVSLRDGSVIRDLASSESLDGVPSALVVVPDGRLVVAMYQTNGVVERGWLDIWHDPAGSGRHESVPLPRDAKVTGLAVDGTYLYLVGNRNLAAAIPIDSLAVEDRR